MKKLVLMAALAVFSLLGQAQVVKHHQYTTHYNSVTREPDSVSWTLNQVMVGCDVSKFPRKDAFKADPQISKSATPADYSNSGYDKGHLFSYDDAVCDQISRVECFYMSNMLPQIHPFNAGDWKVLEQWERQMAAKTLLHIVAGGYGSIGKLKAGENIPAYMWKAIYYDGAWSVWIMPNKATSHGHKFDFWKTSIHTFDLKSIGDQISKSKI